MTRAPLAVYRACARILLPRAFREEYGAELDATVAARLAGSDGAVKRWFALLFELGDLSRTAARVLLAVSVAACLAPARRATAIDPVRVLSAD